MACFLYIHRRWEEDQRLMNNVLGYFKDIDHIFQVSLTPQPPNTTSFHLTRHLRGILKPNTYTFCDWNNVNIYRIYRAFFIDCMKYEWVNFHPWLYLWAWAWSLLVGAGVAVPRGHQPHARDEEEEWGVCKEGRAAPTHPSPPSPHHWLHLPDWQDEKQWVRFVFYSHVR